VERRRINLMGEYLKLMGITRHLKAQLIFSVYFTILSVVERM
jgi:hypothetical protein